MPTTPKLTLNRTSRVAGHESLRAVCLGGLILLELLWLTIQFDTSSVSVRDGAWGELFRRGPQLLQLLIAMLATACLAGRHRLRQHWQAIVSPAQPHADWPVRLAFHGICFSLLLWTTTWLYAGPAVESPLCHVIAIEWLLLAMATCASALAVIAPYATWQAVLRTERNYLLAGALVGVASIALTRSAQSFWDPLADQNLVIVAMLLSCLLPNVVVESGTRLVGTSTFCVEIAPQCSGYEGVGLILIFLAAFTLLFRHRLKFPQAWLLWPLGMAAIWLCNSLRIALLILVGTLFSPAVAMGGFHSQAGWIFFNVVALMLAAAALKIPFFSRGATASALAPKSASAEAWLIPFLTLTGMHLLTAACSSGFDWLYPVKIAGTGIALLVFAPQLMRCPQTAVAPEGSTAWLGGITAVGYGLLVFLFWVPMTAIHSSQSPAQMPEALAQAPGSVVAFWLLFRVAGSTIVIPIVEELAFRGYLMRRFMSREFQHVAYRSVSWSGVLGSSVLFGLMHQDWLAAILAGLVYAQAARQRGRLSDAIIAHAVTNGLICVAVLSGDRWWLW